MLYKGFEVVGHTAKPLLSLSDIVDSVGGMLILAPKKPTRGHVLTDVAIMRLMFTKGKGERHYKVFDVSNLPSI
ncbi:hypothetical protein QVD17_35998 [Tagetes erecta]|uniref:Rad51-like C-terminal domain-containing protein n=1 Tax=Tagetes erecta TaxID=13708 RepID=A0AAD8NHQ7_TARER|nr:hypothetical protein QVD17_35998 [Tagetes erecta]